jgi:hypothetical protein
MNLFRIVFIALSCAAIVGVTYISIQGAGARASHDVERSIRLGSGGIGTTGRVK